MESANQLRNRLLESVQECQKRYGGKTELATEFDECVHCLCSNLEAVFQHGLKSKADAIKAIKQVADIVEIVAHSLSLASDNNSFWSFVSRHLTVHDRERYDALKQIWTDTGKGRAWIRSTLNERSLERYFQSILADKEGIREYYESWALLCDDENNNLLPNMAAGLNSILFAISIDQAVFNSSSANKSEKVKKEPIIETPSLDGKTRAKLIKKKRKEATIITFDDAENVSMVRNRQMVNMEEETRSTTSSSDTQSNSSVQESRHKAPIVRKLSIETSGSREKYATKLEGTLTPLESHIGELTPISVDNACAADVDASEIEVSTDASALLFAVEAQEAIRLREKVSLLTKENDGLKEQLKKYIDAVKLLQVQNECETSPDYKSEAKLFERKLVQVAEMHAELMDFNVTLQQALCQKENLVERLKRELMDLRGPLDAFEEENQGCVHVWIPSAFLTGTASESHHVYQIFLRAGADEWNIYRRYAQFHALHSDLKKLDVAVASFDFPPKKSINKKDSTLVEERRKRLQRYLRKILNHWPELSQCNSRFVLEQHLAFFKEQKAVKKHRLFSSCRSDQSTTSNESHYTGL